MHYTYKKAVVGGTFDHFHLGHQKLIDTAFESSDHVTIGITQPVMYQNKLLSNIIENYGIREQCLKKYLEQKGYLSKVTIIPINDIYGTTLKDKNFDAIFATEETLENVKLINKRRTDIGFSELEVIIVPFVNDENGEKITSERIRKGEIDRNGLVYKNFFKKSLKLSQNLREELQKPLGEVVKDTKSVLRSIQDRTITIAVGDIIVTTLKNEGFTPAIGIIDFKTRRQVIENVEIPDQKRILNEQGTISSEATAEISGKISNYLKLSENQTIIIEGEEDLLALPAILLAPLESVVLYGQFDQGVVVNHITEEFKQKITNLIKKFSQ